MLLWDVQNGRIMSQMTLGFGERELVAMSFSPGARFAGLTKRRQFYWDIATGQTLACHPLSQDSYPMLVVFSPTGRLVATVTGTGEQIKLWEIESWKQLHQLKIGTLVSCLSFSSEGRQVFFCTRGGVYVSDVHTGRHESTIVEIPCSPTVMLAGQTISPDGHLVGRFSSQKAFRLQAAVTGATIIDLDAHENFASRLTFALGGQYAVSYSIECPDDTTHTGNQMIRVWDTKLARLPSPDIGEDPVAVLVSASLQDGWLKGPSNELLLWVPEEYREHLQVPPCTMIIDWCRVVVSQGDSGWHRGESWTACWREYA